MQQHLLTHCIAWTNGEKAQRNTMVTTVIFYPQQQLRIKRQCPADIVLAVQQKQDAFDLVCAQARKIITLLLRHRNNAQPGIFT